MIKSNNELKIFFLGFRKTLPLVGGVIPFGALYATLAGAAGFPGWLTILISIVVFGGSSQLVFIDLYQHLNSALQATLGSNIVNARHLIYSAGVSHHFSEFSLKWKLLLSYLLTDQLYAISQSEQKRIALLPKELTPWFYFGSGFCTWSFWVAATALGMAFGHIIPKSWNLSFSIPLMFMPLVFVVSKSKFAYLTCLFAILFVYLFQTFPFGLGVFFAILLSSFLGFIIKRFWQGRV